MPHCQKRTILKNARFKKKCPIFNKKKKLFRKKPSFNWPDLKQAWRTGLGAQRAQRTKSRGPKGLQLEVGPRRAPRLLVIHNLQYLKLCYLSSFITAEPILLPSTELVFYSLFSTWLRTVVWCVVRVLLIVLCDLVFGIRSFLRIHLNNLVWGIHSSSSNNSTFSAWLCRIVWGNCSWSSSHLILFFALGWGRARHGFVSSSYLILIFGRAARHGFMV